ncbi:uncharacterized protein TRIADDRAFT_29287 [Trichoplax adhaerens]|uniref:Amino acid transporter transmembrane domain-containing protein n=1 Tax=Trichoplax adhaerens TaxID=10228 RepID=B3S562_TRIAD|nr:hypothetical protein TRIADDRAFT_29287 [Trichoplax adhaerens]EDV22079.1 hypothetical protein TRIADDRAFT_29287 [Trichoplax adhaerens]|eukprot:XP_002115234.1 hypothetical protein TRIADDRAFT_29287 [Trichoplax adhaerens]
MKFIFYRFSIWNTMMGTSLLAMPWALGQAGLLLGLGIILIMGGICLYTCYLLVKSESHYSTFQIVCYVLVIEYTDIANKFLGRWGKYSSLFFSILTMFGSLIVYWILMSSFLYNIVLYIIGLQYNDGGVTTNSTSSKYDVICPSASNATTSELNFLQTANMSGFNVDLFLQLWDKQKTVPLFLLVVMFPILNLKSPTFFTKFNSLGAISVCYLIFFVVFKSVRLGINFDLSGSHGIKLVNWNFPALSGILAMGFFIHNCILAIVRNQENPKNNGRDLSIAYLFVFVTYTTISVCFYLSFPMHRSCIQPILLDNFPVSDIMAFFARIGLFFQLVTVYPLLNYIVRIQILLIVFKKAWPSIRHVLLLNIGFVTFCVLFAVFYPHIGTIIRFAGAFCGLAYIFTFPPVIYLVYCKRIGTLTTAKIIIHGFIVLIGVTNVIGQFLIL